MFIERTSEDLRFMVNDEQYLLRSGWKKIHKTYIYDLFFMYMSFAVEKNP